VRNMVKKERGCPIPYFKGGETKSKKMGDRERKQKQIVEKTDKIFVTN